MGYSTYFVKSTPPRVQLILLILCSYISDILKMCMKIFLEDKIIVKNMDKVQLYDEV